MQTTCMTTNPFIGILAYVCNEDPNAEVCCHSRLTDMKWMWNFTSAGTRNLVWILTEVLHISLEKFGNIELTNRAEYSSCLKWSKVNHCMEMMEMACWFVMFLGTEACVYLFFIWIHTKILSLWNTKPLKDYLNHKSLCLSCSKEWEFQ